MAILLNSSVRRAVAGGRGLDDGVVTSRPAVKTERGGGVSERLWEERERGGSGARVSREGCGRRPYPKGEPWDARRVAPTMEMAPRLPWLLL